MKLSPSGDTRPHCAAVRPAPSPVVVHPLEEASLEHLGYKALTEEDVCGRGAKAVPFARLAPDALLNYAGERADRTR